jgi:phospholipid/cholesterol/gamma-HCH transport system substrate-binding protein
MQDSRINYVVVGAFVAAILAAFVIVVSTLAGRTGSTDEYYTIYDNVGGLKFGTLVMYEGYQIGQVDSIEPVIEGNQVNFRVNLSVQEGWNIPSDSLARATVSGLLAAMTIDIEGGKSTTLLKPGEKINGVSASNIFAALSSIGAEFGDLSANAIKPLLGNLNNYVSQLDKTTMEHLPGIMKNLETISGTLAEDLPEITNSLKRTIAIVETDVLAPENREKIDAIIGDLAAFTGDLEETRENLFQALDSVNKLITDNAGNVDESIRSLRYTLDTLARYIDDIAQNADITTRNMAEFSRTIRENPGLLIRSKPQDENRQGGGQ